MGLRRSGCGGREEETPVSARDRTRGGKGDCLRGRMERRLARGWGVRMGLRRSNCGGREEEITVSARLHQGGRGNA